MLKPLGVALLGCGTVGSGVAELLLNQSDRLAKRAGRPIQLRHVVVRNPKRTRTPSLDSTSVSSDLSAALSDSQTEVVLELVGGTDWARQAVLSALDAGKHVVTANKALLAQYGAELFQRA